MSVAKILRGIRIIMLLSICITSIVIFGTISACYYHWSRRKLYKLARQFRGPPAWPIIGNGLTFFCKNEEVLNRIYHMILSVDGRDPIKFWLGSKLLIIFRDPQHVEKVMSSQKFAYKNEIYDYIKAYLGEGLVTASGPAYKLHRKLIQPLINIQFTSSFYEVFRDNINLAMKKLEKYVDGNTFDMHEVTHKCFVDVIGESILGKEMKIQQNGNTEFVVAAVDIYNLGCTRLSKPWLHPDIIFNNTYLKKTELKLMGIVNNFLQGVIDKAWERKKTETHLEKEKIPLIDQITTLIEENPNLMNNEVFMSHMFTLYLASEDTLTINSSFICLCFGMYPEYQNKAAEEIREVFGDKPRDVTLDDIGKLKYLDMCIKDVLRLVPIAPVLLRRVIEDCQIDNWTIPKSSAILVPIFNLHRDPNQWENPLHFYPDHFLPEAVNKRHIYSYIPFSAGPRGCIGKVFANIGLRLWAATFLQHFEVEADGKFPEFKLRMDISTRPLEGYNLRVRKRVWK